MQILIAFAFVVRSVSCYNLAASAWYNSLAYANQNPLDECQEDSDCPSSLPLCYEKTCVSDEKSYTLVNENVRCSGTTPIFKGPKKSNDECREYCVVSYSCKFYAIWTTTGWCETYSECPSESPAGTHSIHLWKKSVLDEVATTDSTSDEATVEVTTTTLDSTSSSVPEIVDCLKRYALVSKYHKEIIRNNLVKYAECQEAQKLKMHQYYMSKFQELLA